jgi:hypothetical protein
MPKLEHLPLSWSSFAPGLGDAWNAWQNEMEDREMEQEVARLEGQWQRERREIDRGGFKEGLKAICQALFEGMTMPVRGVFGAGRAFLVLWYGDNARTLISDT